MCTGPPRIDPVIYPVVLGAAFMLAPVAIDLYLPALPTIADSLHTGIDEMEATVSVFLFGFALGQLLLGPISDAYGRRVVLLSGTVVFVAASFLVGTAQTIEQLMAWRFLQALGGAGSVAVFPLVRDRFNQADSTRIISYIMVMGLVAPIVAPILGGYILAYSGWRTIFGVVAGFGVVSLLATAAFIRDRRSDRRAVSFKQVVGGYRSVLSERRIVLAILSAGLAFAGLFAFIAGSPFVYIIYFGVDPEHYGYLVGLNGTAMIGANLVNARRLASADPIAKVLAGAVVLAFAGVAVLGAAALGWGLVPLVAAIVLFFGALGITETNAVVAALSVLPERNGSVAALNGAFQFGIGALSSFSVSIIASTDAVPMAIVMAASGVAVLLSAVLLKRTAHGAGGVRVCRLAGGVSRG